MKTDQIFEPNALNNFVDICAKINDKYGGPNRLQRTLRFQKWFEKIYRFFKRTAFVVFFGRDT